MKTFCLSLISNHIIKWCCIVYYRTDKHNFRILLIPAHYILFLDFESPSPTTVLHLGHQVTLVAFGRGGTWWAEWLLRHLRLRIVKPSSLLPSVDIRFDLSDVDFNSKVSPPAVADSIISYQWCVGGVGNILDIWSLLDSWWSHRVISGTVSCISLACWSQW